MMAGASPAPMSSSARGASVTESGSGKAANAVGTRLAISAASFARRSSFEIAARRERSSERVGEGGNRSRQALGDIRRLLGAPLVLSNRRVVFGENGAALLLAFLGLIENGCLRAEDYTHVVRGLTRSVARTLND